MESSEDDAGPATSASRRPSAREKDVGLAEDVDAARNIQLESSETRASLCGTPAMSEDNFDGDSIPSPSSKVPSTEAVLDMIDDFIGNPRTSRLLTRVRTPPVRSLPVSKHNKQSEKPKEQTTTPARVLTTARVSTPAIAPTTARVPTPASVPTTARVQTPASISTPACVSTPARVPTPPAPANIEIPCESVKVQPAVAECTPQSEILICVNTSTNEEVSQASSSVQVDSNESCSTQQPEISENVIPNVSTEELVVAPPSSSVETVQVISDTSECDNLERTLNCVISSESRDSVTVELAESTSSECSVSESKAPSIEPIVSRSPLKRRLIRPVPSDRRPDSTVSSTVDSQTTDILTSEQTGSDTIAKDVSSSSDAVPHVHGITTPEEISDVSEISICKAETSTSSRKIKLVRPKLTPVLSNSVKSEAPTTTPPIERDRCQSTSSDEISTPSVEAAVDTSSSISVEISEQQETRPEPVPDILTTNEHHALIPVTPQDATSNSDTIVIDNPAELDPQCIETPQVVEPSVPDKISLAAIEAPIADVLSSDTHLQNEQKENSSQEIKEVPPVELNLTTADTATDKEEAQCSSPYVAQAHKTSQSEPLPSTPMDQDFSLTPTMNCDSDNKKIIEEINDCDTKDDQTKVPPVNINKTNEDLGKKPEILTILKRSLTDGDDLISTRSEESKQVPKLTIIGTEEAESLVTKMAIKPLTPPVEPNTEVHDQQMPSATKVNIKPILTPTEKEMVLKSEEKSADNCATIEQIPSGSKIKIKSTPKPLELVNESKSTLTPSPIEQNADISDTGMQIQTVTEFSIKATQQPAEEVIQNSSSPPQHTAEQDAVLSINIKPISNETNLNTKPVSKSIEKAIENNLKSIQHAEISTESSVTTKEIPSVRKLNIKPIQKPAEKLNESTSNPLQAVTTQDAGNSESCKPIPNVTKINIKPIPKPSEMLKESVSKTSEKDVEDKQIPSVTKINIKPILKPSDEVNESPSKSLRPNVAQENDDHDSVKQISSITKLNIKPITKPVEKSNECTSKPLPQDTELNDDDQTKNMQIPCVTKLNIKSIPKPSQIVNDCIQKSVSETVQNDVGKNEQFPIITKLNIKPILKPPEKVNEIHRKSSSSEISESEYSENDESTSTSDQASASDQGPLNAVPKLTIKLGKPGTVSEGKFYTEKNVPKLTIKNVQQSDKDDQMKLIISQSDDTQIDKVPKITIKTVTKSDSQPLSPKLTIKPIKPPESINKDEIPKLKISTEPYSSNADVKENLHVPKITIKPVTKTDGDGITKTPKKSTMMCDSSEHIPVVTKLNIKPILKPTESGESSQSYDEKVPVVSKLNIKPVIKPKDNEVDSSIEDVPKITKLNIKPIKNPEESSSDKKDCDEMNADMKDSCIPVITKLNIKPIVKPVEEEALKDSENQSSETGNSSDDNTDHIPVVTKINIKPIVKPSGLEEPTKPTHNEQSIPVVTKLNIKPLVKPEDQVSPASPKKESLKSPGSSGIPVVTKLNIKPVVKPENLQDGHQEESIEKSSKPPLLMKINMKNVSDSISELEHLHNDVTAKAHSPKMVHSPKMAHSPKMVHSPKMAHSPKATKRTVAERNAELSTKPASSISDEVIKNSECNRNSPSLIQTECASLLAHSGDIVPETVHSTTLNSARKQQSTSDLKITEETVPEKTVQESKTKSELLLLIDSKISKKNAIQGSEMNDKNRVADHYNTNYSKASNMNCTLLKKLLSSTKEIEKSPDTKSGYFMPQSESSESSMSNCKDSKAHEENKSELFKRLSSKSQVVNEFKHSSDSIKIRPIEEVHREANESVTTPLEIVTDKIANQSSGQDSPRIILKINKTDHGASSKIITEETHKPTDSSPPNDNRASEVVETMNDTSPKKHVNSRKKAAAADLAANVTMGKRLRSSRIVESAEKSPVAKRNAHKRPTAADSPSLLQQKESEQSIFETKKMKLEQLLSTNKSLTITPVVSKVIQASPSKSSMILNQGGKVSHSHSLLNNENSQKNGNSKLQNILSNLQAKQLQTLQMKDTTATEKSREIHEVESSVSTGSSDVVVEITRVENCQLEVQEMLINENSVCDLTGPDDVSQDPLEVERTKTPLPEVPKEPVNIQAVEVTPTPRKRGRPRKTPLVETEKSPTPAPAPLPVPALEERPQRSLRLLREKPPVVRKTRGRGRGRGRGGRRTNSPRAPSPDPDPDPDPEPQPEPEAEPEPVIVVEVAETRPASPIDPTSSRIKLPRMTEALDKSVAGASCTTPLSSRRRSSSQTDLKLFGSAAVVLDSPVKGEELMKTPEATRPKSGRGSRGGRGRTPRNRGRGRGGGRGAMYMKETMGIYGRVCGPATTTVQLFEEETCMMDDNATPSKPSHLLDEDSQSSVKSSTNDSNKMKKSKFADLFDSNKVWTAADVKEYTWPPPDTPNAESQIMMIQEQVAMFLGVKSFKRRYPELKRRTVGGEEREYVLSKEIVTEALCDLGITAVDASEVLDIMLSDYPHKYEEYRSHQRAKQIAAAEEPVEVKVEEKPTKVEVKPEKTTEKPEPPKVDPEKTRQDMAAAAIASAAEWNARANAWRRPACVDLQSNTIHRRRAPPATLPPPRVRPPHGFYPHALLPGQFQHWYRTYTPEQLRYFPLTTALAAPPPAPSPAESSSESEGSWGDNSSSSDDSDTQHHHSAKRKKLSRAKRSSQQDKEDSRGGAGGAGGEVDTCRVCRLRLEANRKHTHERFLVCANCNAKLHPACVELPADTIRKCRSYAWQCAECKTCCACRRPQDDDKMLFCDLCDRGFHIYCVGLTAVPSGRWHCVECAICKSCGARDPNGLTPGAGTPGPSTPGLSTPGPSTPGPSTPGPSTPGVSTPGGPGEWHHQTRRGPGGHKVYSHSLCTPCARVR